MLSGTLRSLDARLDRPVGHFADRPRPALSQFDDDHIGAAMIGRSEGSSPLIPYWRHIYLFLANFTL